MTTRPTGTIEAHMPGGLWARISGLHAGNLLQLVMIIMVGVLLWSVWHEETQRDRRYGDLQMTLATMQSTSHTIIKNQDEILRRTAAMTEEQETMTYVLTLTQQQRERLNLQMPDKLRARVR